MELRFWHIILILLIFTLSGHAQKLSELSARQLKAMGKNALDFKDPHSAIDYYKALIRKKDNNPEIMFTLAECYRSIRDYPLALKWYKKAYKADPKKYAEAQYYWATMLMTQKQYKEAYDELKKFKKATQGQKAYKGYSKLCRKQMSGCRMAQRDSGTVVWMKHVDTTINRPSIEFSPFFIDYNTLIFASLRSDTTVHTSTIDENNIPVRQFYVANRKDDEWVYKSKWNDVPFNDQSINTGNGALSPDGQRFYFTRCIKNWKSETICSIYLSNKDAEGNWSEPQKLPEIINSPKYTTTQPAVGTYSKKKEEILYFVSNRAGGKGEMDIWYSRYQAKKKQWKTPKNCGGKINTPGNEFTPFVEMTNSTMYFSSDAGEGLGQLDIYKAVGEMGKWMPTENLKAPINSPFDDYNYTLNKDQTEGFFVSNRPGGNSQLHPTCCDDLYTFKYDEIIRVTATGSIYARIDKKFTTMFGADGNEKVEVDSSFQLSEGVPVTLFMIDESAPMGAGNMVYVKSDSLDANGRFSFDLEAGKEYVIDVENYGYFNQKYNLSTLLYTQSDTMQLDTVGIDLMPRQAITISNLYYESGKSELGRVAKKEIDKTLLKLLQENSQIVIEISSHTDNKGRDKANQLLSQKRADGVRKYLMRKGIDKDRLYARGYGENRPVASNDTKEGREKNRRTEFKIIGSLDQYTELNYQK